MSQFLKHTDNSAGLYGVGWCFSFTLENSISLDCVILLGGAMRRLTFSTSYAANEQGNAMLEFLLSLPFILLVFYGSIDLGRAFNTYFTITRVVYEGTRFAGTVGGLELGSYANAALAASAPGHQRVRARVDTLLLRYNINPGTLPPEYLATERLQIAGGRDQVRVTLRLPFRADFPLLRGVLRTLGTDAVGPYLFF